MNERFFDLKKDRQDRIINGALRIFAQNSYRHASTDEMVAAASISKGLLFHYFKSKKGAWEFLYEYSTRYTLLELREAGRRQGCDFFEMHRQLAKADAVILRKYPYMPLFLRRAKDELDMGAPGFRPEIPRDLAHAVADRRLSLVIEADRPPFLSEQDALRISQILEYTRFGLMQELLSLEESAAGAKAGKGQKSSKTDAVPSFSGAGEEAPADNPEELAAEPPLDKQYTDRLTGYLQTLRRMNL